MVLRNRTLEINFPAERLKLLAGDTNDQVPRLQSVPVPPLHACRRTGSNVTIVQGYNSVSSAGEIN